MSSAQTIISENREYWSRRSATYSIENRNELAAEGHSVWQGVLRELICSHIPDRGPGDVHILEAGTGPGFFAILLAELGYRVTAVDLTPSMLDEARNNAGRLAGSIRFIEMDAEALDFPDAAFDVVVSRNLTWNLPHPEQAYREWRRVLKPDGLLLNFDANWYGYLFDARALEAYEQDRRNTAQRGIRDANIGENFDVMEKLAGRLPLSGLARPQWDRDILEHLGFSVKTDPHIWERVWSENEKVNFASTPLFLVRAVRRRGME